MYKLPQQNNFCVICFIGIIMCLTLLDLNQKAVSTHSSLTGLLSLPDDDQQYMQQQHDQRPPPFGYSSLPRMGIPPPVHGGEHLPRYPMPPPPPHHMMQGPPPPGYPMMGPPHPHMSPYPTAAAKHNSLPPGIVFVLYYLLSGN